MELEVPLFINSCTTFYHADTDSASRNGGVVKGLQAMIDRVPAAQGADFTGAVSPRALPSWLDVNLTPNLAPPQC